MGNVHRKVDSLDEDIGKLTDLIDIIGRLLNAMLQEVQPNEQSINELKQKISQLRDAIQSNFNKIQEMKTNIVKSNARQRIIKNQTNLTKRYYNALTEYGTLAVKYKASCIIRTANEMMRGPNLCDPFPLDELKNIYGEIDEKKLREEIEKRKVFEDGYPFVNRESMLELHSLITDSVGDIDIINKQESDNLTIEDHVNNDANILKLFRLFWC
ncbi:unnamed protein product [Adineta steineri]|uniref:Uncharacterized protein n=1 Tax=Adineta steineri TaxID=433720 RepID=A0A813QB39_9BILA|nr:unnamed protein product [Adineta steineri]CAF0766754.1 unnamed protein product [Adineta steineri]CAF0924027.1 unnamed protein product [Adineta steineri]